jgi:hypothetical protein
VGNRRCDRGRLGWRRSAAGSYGGVTVVVGKTGEVADGDRPRCCAFGRRRRSDRGHKPAIHDWRKSGPTKRLGNDIFNQAPQHPNLPVERSSADRDWPPSADALVEPHAVSTSHPLPIRRDRPAKPDHLRHARRAQTRRRRRRHRRRGRQIPVRRDDGDRPNDGPERCRPDPRRQWRLLAYLPNLHHACHDCRKLPDRTPRRHPRPSTATSERCERMGQF